MLTVSRHESNRIGDFHFFTRAHMFQTYTLVVFTGAYSRIREQFRTPIGYFEGIEEALAYIGGQTYAMESARLLVLSSLDNGDIPSVVSGIVKQQIMERMRLTINYSMDIHGGHGICMGPLNHLGRA